jgi:23S rRNA (guanosine2251-2'-O)-methyltransferase
VSDHPRDRFVTVYGRKPVLEALAQPDLQIDKVLVAQNAKGDVVKDILDAARRRGLRVRRVPSPLVNRLSRNARQDQGVVADVVAPLMAAVQDGVAALGPVSRLLAFDGVTTPGTLGLALRGAVAAGLDGVLLPRKGTVGLDPMVIKASAGVAFRARILRCADIAEGLDVLRAEGFHALGLEGGGTSLFDLPLPDRCVFVAGSESEGLSPEARERLDGRVGIPMAAGVESLNVAMAATLVAYEVTRRG